jgi:signal peptidase I
MSLAVWIGSAIAGSLLVRWARRRWLIVTVRGTSMMPTLGDGQRLIVRRACGDQARLRVGDIVVFTAPEHERFHPMPGAHYLVKRVAALGDASGEHLSSDRVVVLGDNLPASQDSRHFGPVDRRSIIGIALRENRPASSSVHGHSLPA